LIFLLISGNFNEFHVHKLLVNGGGGNLKEMLYYRLSRNGNGKVLGKMKRKQAGKQKRNMKIAAN